MRESQCRAELTMMCIGVLAGIKCRHYQESVHTPLKCRHRDGAECINHDACRDALEALIDNIRIPSGV